MKRSDESDFDMIWRLRGERNALRKRIDAAEAALAEIAEMPRQRRDDLEVGEVYPTLNDMQTIAEQALDASESEDGQL